MRLGLYGWIQTNMGQQLGPYKDSQRGLCWLGSVLDRAVQTPKTEPKLNTPVRILKYPLDCSELWFLPALFPPVFWMGLTLGGRVCGLGFSFSGFRDLGLKVWHASRNPKPPPWDFEETPSNSTTRPSNPNCRSPRHLEHHRSRPLMLRHDPCSQTRHVHE